MLIIMQAWEERFADPFTMNRLQTNPCNLSQTERTRKHVPTNVIFSDVCPVRVYLPTLLSDFGILTSYGKSPCDFLLDQLCSSSRGRQYLCGKKLQPMLLSHHLGLSTLLTTHSYIYLLQSKPYCIQ